MKIAIIDTINQDVGLKIVFPDADYYSIVEQFDRSIYYNRYNFHCRTDIENITSENYDTIFIISPLYNTMKIYKGRENTSYNREFDECLCKVINIINANSFKHVCIFDNYDYDYDPNVLMDEHTINSDILFFKRNYNKELTYKNNVFPFPYIIFGYRCNIDMVNNLHPIIPPEKKINRLFFAGSIFTHTDEVYGIVRDRKITLQRLQGVLPEGFLFVSNYSYDQYIAEMCNSKFCLDLLGCGDPNIRTFEIFSTQTLRIAERSKVSWNFPEDFSEETYFDSPEDLQKKITLLQSNPDLYRKCLDKQNMIVKKYMNPEYLNNYISDIICNYPTDEELKPLEPIPEKFKFILVTSIINISQNPLSYTPIRSVFTKNQRFQQTQNTIKNIRKNLPNYKIILVECSDLDVAQTKYFKENVDIFLNMYNEPNRQEYIDKINSPSKSMGEGTITKFALKFLLYNKIPFDSFAKISGRYWINEKFNYYVFCEQSNIVNANKDNKKNVCTSLYKLSKEAAVLWYNYLLTCDEKFANCEGYELIFGDFIDSISNDNKITYMDKIGVSGFIAVDGSYMEW